MQQILADYNDVRAARRIGFTEPDAGERIVAQVEEFGFAVVSLPDAESPETALASLAEMLGLGDPFVPQTASIENNSGLYKRVSDYTDVEGWHVDGLLEKIGTVKTTVLHCVRAARKGGDTVLFNALAAYTELRKADLAAAESLLSPAVLTRRAKLPGDGYGAAVTGPAFAVGADGSMITRFSDNHTCRWNDSAGSPGDVDRALSFMRDAATNSRYRVAVRLAPDEALILRNDRLSHDRSRYEENPAAPRLLVRGLYTRSPSLPGV